MPAKTIFLLFIICIIWSLRSLFHYLSLVSLAATSRASPSGYLYCVLFYLYFRCELQFIYYCFRNALAFRPHRCAPISAHILASIILIFIGIRCNMTCVWRSLQMQTNWPFSSPIEWKKSNRKCQKMVNKHRSALRQRPAFGTQRIVGGRQNTARSPIYWCTEKKRRIPRWALTTAGWMWQRALIVAPRNKFRCCCVIGVLLQFDLWPHGGFGFSFLFRFSHSICVRECTDRIYAKDKTRINRRTKNWELARACIQRCIQRIVQSFCKHLAMSFGVAVVVVSPSAHSTSTYAKTIKS